MKSYKIYAEENYIYIVDTAKTPNEYFRGQSKDVFVDKSNIDSPTYRFFNMKNWDSATPIELAQIKDKANAPYTILEFDTFYSKNTGGFGGSGGNSATTDALLTSILAKLDDLQYKEIIVPITFFADISGDGTLYILLGTNVGIRTVSSIQLGIINIGGGFTENGIVSTSVYPTGDIEINSDAPIPTSKYVRITGQK